MEENKQVAVRENMQVSFTTDEIETIKNTVAREATDTELKLFLHQCKRTGLDPFSRQIYFLKMGGKASIQSSIDGFRLIAERSGKYAGQTVPLYLDSAGKWHEVWTQKGYPVAAKVGVLRSDFKEPLYAIAKWDSYCPTYNGKVGTMWAKMPEVMIAKVAEALALRKAFPNDLSGIYASEEMSQAETVEHKPMAAYEVKRAVPAEDDEAGGAVIQTEAPTLDAQFMEKEEIEEVQRDQIKKLVKELGEVPTPRAVLKLTGMKLEPANFEAIIEALKAKVAPDAVDALGEAVKNNE